jgi:hypothetical protein
MVLNVLFINSVCTVKLTQTYIFAIIQNFKNGIKTQQTNLLFRFRNYRNRYWKDRIVNINI